VAACDGVRAAIAASGDVWEPYPDDEEFYLLAKDAEALLSALKHHKSPLVVEVSKEQVVFDPTSARIMLGKTEGLPFFRLRKVGGQSPDCVLGVGRDALLDALKTAHKQRCSLVVKDTALWVGETSVPVVWGYGRFTADINPKFLRQALRGMPDLVSLEFCDGFTRIRHGGADGIDRCAIIAHVYRTYRRR